MGLGSGGNPLTDVAKNLPSAGNNQQGMNSNQGPPNISQNAAAAAALGAAGLAQVQSLLSSQQMQTPNPGAMASLMGTATQGSTAGQGGTGSTGLTNELSALAVIARQLQNAGGIQGLSALAGNITGGAGPTGPSNNTGGNAVHMPIKNEGPGGPGGMGMNQVKNCF